MKYVIDLTRNNFDRVDFTEAKIVDFYCQQVLPQELQFTVWGATLLLSSMWKHDEEFDDFLPKTDDMYVSGLGKIKITNLIGGSIEVYAYDNKRDENKRIINAKNWDGSELAFKREWKTDNSKTYNEYLWECVIMWPYGFSILKLNSDNGTVTYEFDSDNLASVEKFRRNPDIYSFKQH